MIDLIEEVLICIVSDLHCTSDISGRTSTYLHTTIPRSPALHHPVESLRKLIQDYPQLQNSKLLLCPGDITDKIDQTGFNVGWRFIEEIASMIKSSPEMIASVGNHDYDSRNIHGGQNKPESFAKRISDNYPFSKDCSSYWGKDYELIYYDDLCILNINSTASHAKPILKDGKFEGVITRLEESTLLKIENEIKDISNDFFKIALLHHHPIQYSDVYQNSYSDRDILSGGDVLLKLLSNYKFDIVIHGHKHVPRFNILDDLPILCSGSFSSLENLQETNSRNTFHLLKLYKNSDKSKVGEIFTWEFTRGNGWSIPKDFNAKMPFQIGFGLKRNEKDLMAEVDEYFSNSKDNIIPLDKLLANFKQLRFMNPQLANLFISEIKTRFNYELVMMGDGKKSLVKKNYGTN